LQHEKDKEIIIKIKIKILSHVDLYRKGVLVTFIYTFKCLFSPKQPASVFFHSSHIMSDLK